MPKPSILTINELKVLVPRLAATAEFLQKMSRGKGASVRVAPRTAGTPKRRPSGDGAATEAKIVKLLEGAKNGLQTGEIASKVGEDRERVFYFLRAGTRRSRRFLSRAQRPHRACDPDPARTRLQTRTMDGRV